MSRGHLAPLCPWIVGRSTAVSASMVRTRNKILPEEEMCCPVEWRNMSVADWCWWCFSLGMVKGRQKVELSSVPKWKMEVLEQIEGFWLLMQFDLYWSEKGNG